MQREGVCNPLYHEQRHTLLCNETGSLSSLYRREALYPLHVTELQSLLCVEKTLSLLYRDILSIGKRETHSPLQREVVLSPPCREERHSLLDI